MKKIDRLGWTDGISILSYGVRVGVRVNDAEALKRVMTVLPPGWKYSPSPIVDTLFSLYSGGPGARPNMRRFSLLYNGIDRIARSLDEDPLYTTLETNLRIAVAEFAPRRLFLHAGAVGWKNQAIIIPGSSYSGKTTLVAEFVRAGATYYSDEYAVLDQQGRVHNFLKPLSIREKGTQEQTSYAVEDLGGKPGKKPLQVGVVVLSNYREGAHWRPRDLTAGRGALEMLAHAISARHQPGVALSTLHKVASRASVLKSKRGEARQVVDSILKRLDEGG